MRPRSIRLVDNPFLHADPGLDVGSISDKPGEEGEPLEDVPKLSAFTPLVTSAFVYSPLNHSLDCSTEVHLHKWRNRSFTEPQQRQASCWRWSHCITQSWWLSGRSWRCIRSVRCHYCRKKDDYRQPRLRKDPWSGGQRSWQLQLYSAVLHWLLVKIYWYFLDNVWLT